MFQYILKQFSLIMIFSVIFNKPTAFLTLVCIAILFFSLHTVQQQGGAL